MPEKTDETVKEKVKVKTAAEIAAEDRAKSAVSNVNYLLSELKKQLGEELSLISYKDGIVKKIGQEISAGFTIVELSLQLLDELKTLIEVQKVKIDKELSELESIKENIRKTEDYSNARLAVLLRDYKKLSGQASVNKSRLAKLFAKIQQIGEIVKSPRFKESKVLQTRLTKAWMEVQVLQKTIKTEYEFGGDIEKYEVFLGQVKNALEKQLEEIAGLVKNWKEIRKLHPASLPQVSKTNQNERQYDSLKAFYARLLARINSEKEAEERLEERLPALATKYEEVKKAVELE